MASDFVYHNELSNSVQSIDLSAKSHDDKENYHSEDSEESSIEKAIMAEAPMILPQGYQLSHCLAEGGMGRVFLVVNHTTKDCLAAKVVSVYGRFSSHDAKSTAVALDANRVAAKAASIRAQLRHEAELQRRLKHSNIAAVYGIRNTASFAFMFMELLACGELFERIPVGIGLHIQQMFMYYAQMVDALHYLHEEQAIAHLDVKPENIMLNRKDRAKLIDFGFATDLRQSPLCRGLVGTLGYAAPETFGRSSYAGPPADFFSLGVTLVNAVTGQHCWARADPRVDPVYAAWCDRRGLHSASAPFARLPADLTNFLTRALAHRPAERLTTAAAVRAHPWFKRGLLRRLTPLAPPLLTTTTTTQGSLGPADCAMQSKLAPNGTVPCSQPVLCTGESESTICPTTSGLPLFSQPVDPADLLASQAVVSSVDGGDLTAGGDSGYVDRLQFSCLMRRMTRFFSALSSLEHTMEVVRAVIAQRRQLRPTVKGPANLLVEIRHPDHPATAFRVLLYPLAGAIMADWRRVSGDGLLFRQTYAGLYTDLKGMGAVNEQHPYLSMVLPAPEATRATDSDKNSAESETDKASEGTEMLLG